MPPDSLVQVPGKLVDTFRVTSNKLDTIHAITSQPAAQPELKTWVDNYYYPVATTLIAALLIFIITIFRKRLIEIVNRKTIRLVSISEATANEVSKNFIPNSYEVLDSDNSPIERVEVNCMDYFLKKILRDEYSFYFISASTGVGKTTFLLNVYLHYKKRSKGYHSLYFGRAHDPVFRKTIDQLIQSGKAGETILLIDALDEFEIKAKSPDEYWKKFEAFWDVYKVKLTHFKKVIVTVREQFLQFRSIEKVKITSGTGVSISRQIKLLPFVSESQRELYLDKRYADKDSTYRDHLKWLAFKFEQKGLNFIHLPLILNFMEDIWTEYQKEKQKNIADPLENSNFFTLFNLLRIIENAWLKREAKNKGFDQQQIEMIRKFCIDLAYQIARSGRQTTISGKDLINFEKEKDVIRQFQGAGDRSLLVRKKGVTEQEDLYGFVHNYFLELFLIQYVLQQPETVNDISFVNFQFTIDVITRFQWDKIKKIPPAMPPPLSGKHYLELTSAHFETLVTWFDQVYYNHEIRQLLETNNSVLQVIERQDPEWMQYLSHLNGLKITRSNFWDSSTDAPLPLANKAVRLLKPFIKEVSLEKISLKDEHVVVFRGISSLTILDLHETAITIEGLAEFKMSFPSLNFVDLSRLDLGDDCLQFFKDARALKFIVLNINYFTNNGLEYLKNSRDEVVELFLQGNKFDDDGVSFYEGVSQIKKLSISQNSISIKSLQYFSRSFSQLDYLDISALTIPEEHLLILPDFENLECLFIAQNKYKGSCLTKFSKCAKTLGRLDLSGNEFDDAALEALRGVENIWALTLNSNPIRGSGLQIFEACAKTLKQIDLSNTLIGDDAFIHFLHTEKLTHIDLSNISISGKGLICFKNNHSVLEDLYLTNNDGLAPDSLWVFQSFSNIKRLRMAGMNITNKELTYFSKSRATLKKLDIRNNPGITDLSFPLSCPNLAVLVLSNYEQFDEKQLEQLTVKKVKIISEENSIEEHFDCIWPDSVQ